MRLTNDMRDFIIKEATNSTLEKREKALVKESNNLAVLVYERLYPPEIQAQMAKLPDEFFHQESIIYVYPKANSRSDEIIMLNLTSSRKISARDHEWHRPKWIIDGIENAITKRIQTLSEKRSKLSLDRDRLRSSIRTMLRGIHTVKQLREEWPDGEAYYKLFSPAHVKNLPAVRGADVNEMILSMGEEE